MQALWKIFIYLCYHFRLLEDSILQHFLLFTGLQLTDWQLHTMERRNFSFPMPSFLRNSRNNMKNEDSAVILPPNSPEIHSVEVPAVRPSPSKPLAIANNSSPKHSSIASLSFASPKLPSSPFYNRKSSSSPSLTVGGPPLALSNPFRQMSNVRTNEGTPRSFVTANRLFSGSPSESRASFQTPSFKIKQEVLYFFLPKLYHG